VFLRRFRNPIRVPRISNRVPRITENYHLVPKIRENRVPRISEIASLQIHIGYLTFSLKKKLIKPYHTLTIGKYPAESCDYLPMLRATRSPPKGRWWIGRRFCAFDLR